MAAVPGVLLDQVRRRPRASRWLAVVGVPGRRWIRRPEPRRRRPLLRRLTRPSTTAASATAHRRRRHGALLAPDRRRVEVAVHRRRGPGVSRPSPGGDPPEQRQRRRRGTDRRASCSASRPALQLEVTGCRAGTQPVLRLPRRVALDVMRGPPGGLSDWLNALTVTGLTSPPAPPRRDAQAGGVVGHHTSGRRRVIHCSRRLDGRTWKAASVDARVGGHDAVPARGALGAVVDVALAPSPLARRASDPLEPARSDSTWWPGSRTGLSSRQRRPASSRARSADAAWPSSPAHFGARSYRLVSSRLELDDVWRRAARRWRSSTCRALRRRARGSRSWRHPTTWRRQRQSDWPRDRRRAVRCGHRRSSRHQRRASGRTAPQLGGGSVEPDG